MKMPAASTVAQETTPETAAISNIATLMYKVTAQLNFTQSSPNHQFINKPHKDPIVIEDVAALQSKLTEFMSRD